MITVKTKDGFPSEIKLSNMTKKEYAVFEKLYETPMAGDGIGSDGKKFSWKLYTVAVHEYKYFDDDAEAMKVVTLNPPENMSFFKSAKSFCEPFDKLALNTKVKVTQTPVEGKAYSEFVLEEVGKGTAQPPEPDKTKETADDTPMATFVQNLKKSGVDREQVVTITLQKYSDQTKQVVEAVYDSI